MYDLIIYTDKAFRSIKFEGNIQAFNNSLRWFSKVKRDGDEKKVSIVFYQNPFVEFMPADFVLYFERLCLYLKNAINVTMVSGTRLRQFKIRKWNNTARIKNCLDNDFRVNDRDYRLILKVIKYSKGLEHG